MKPQTSPEIKVDRATAKMIAQVVCAEIKASLTENKRIYELAERCERQYAQITQFMAQNREVDSPWKNAADYFIPLTEWTIDAVWARVMNVLFSQEPYMEAKGVESSDVERAPGVTDFVDMVFREKINIYDNVCFFFKQVIKIPFAVLKYDTVKEYEPIITREEAQTFSGPNGEEEDVLPDDPEAMMKTATMIANGYQPQGTREVWVQQDRELHNGPKLKYVIFRDYVWASNAKRGVRLFWEGDRDWQTMNDLLVKSNQGKFIKESVDMIRNSLETAGKEGAEKVIAQRAEKRECFHWYGRMPFNKSNEIDFNDPDAIEQEVYVYVDYKAEETLQIMHWYHRRIPFPSRVYIRQDFEETENFEGRSLAQKLYMTQKEINSLHNTIMNNAWLAMQKIFVKRKTLTGDEWENPTVYPGAMWEEDQPGDIRVLEVGDIKVIGLELETTLLNFAERVSNISIYQTGTARNENGQKTKGEVDTTVREGNIGLDKFVQRCHNTLREICKWTVDYYFEDMPEGLERRIRGDEGQMLFPTQENMPLYQKQGVNPQWSKDDLAGQFDFIWNGTSLNSSKEWNLQVANDLMDRFLPQPMVGGSMLYTWEILRENLRARGIKDWQKYIPKREAIIQEMQRMAQESAMRPNPSPMQPQPSKGPDNARPAFTGQ